MRRFMFSLLALVAFGGAIGCGTSVTVEPGLYVLDTSPSGGAVNVDPEVELFIVLSQELDAASLTSVTLVDEADNAVEAVVTQLADKRVLSVAPANALERDSVYLLTIDGALASSTGEILGASISKRFRTAP